MTVAHEDLGEVTPNATNTVVVAGAGAGKTRALVTEYISALLGLDGTGKMRSPHRVLAITFTDKAAAEMKSRVAATLSEIARSRVVPESLKERMSLYGNSTITPEDAEWLSRQLPGAPISTFHALCLNLLKGDLSLGAGVDPGFQLLDEAEAALLVAEMAEGVILDRLSAGDNVVAEMSARFQLRSPGTGFGFIHQLSSLYRSLSEQGRAAIDLRPVCGQSTSTEQRKKAVRDLRASLTDFIRALEASEYRYAHERRATVLASTEALFDVLAKAKDPDDEVDIVRHIDRLRKENRSCGPGKIEALRQRFFLDVESLAAALIDEAMSPMASTICELLVDVEARVRRELDARGVLGFGDLLVRVRDVLRDDVEARARVKSRFDRILVDEYQDTSPVQEDLVALLSEMPNEHRVPESPTGLMGKVRMAPGRLFVVGDPKQSIYGFRGADARIFAHTLDVIEKGSEHTPATGERKNLSTNYRSEPAILSLVNTICEDALPQGEFGVPFGEDAKLRPHKTGGPLAGAMLTPLSYDEEDGEKAEAHMLARKVRALLDEPSPYGDDEKIEPKNIAVLLRRIAPAADIAHALGHVGVPAHITGGAGFYTRPEIVDAICALRVLAEPDDELATLALVRSPFLAFSDDCILNLTRALEGQRFSWTSMASVVETLPEEFARTFKRLSDLMNGLRDELPLTPLTQIFDRLVTDSGYLLTVGVTADAIERFANIEKLRSILVGDAVPLIERLYNALDRAPKEAPASVFEPDTNAVQIMTIHQSKGLEFPVVFLADLGTKLYRPYNNIMYDRDLGVAVSARGRTISQLDSRDHPVMTAQRRCAERAAERENAELCRVLYVALTRTERRVFLLGEDNDDRSDTVSMKRIIERARVRNFKSFEALLPVERVDVSLPPKRPLPARELPQVDFPATRIEKGALKIQPSDFTRSQMSVSKRIDLYAKRQGRLRHTLVAKAHAEVIANERPLEEVLNAIARADGVDPTTLETKAAMQDAQVLLNGPIRQLRADGFELTFEVPLSFAVTNLDRPVIVNGFADCIARRADEVVAIEMKSSRRAALAEATANQLYAYSCALLADGEQNISTGTLVFGDPDFTLRPATFGDDEGNQLLTAIARLIVVDEATTLQDVGRDPTLEG